MPRSSYTRDRRHGNSSRASFGPADHPASSIQFLRSQSENGDPITIDHRENIAFDPGPDGPADFYVVSGWLGVFSTFEAVTSAALLNTEGQVQT